MLHGLKPLPRVEAPEPMNIELTEVETQVCNILEKFTAHLKDTKGVSTSCRIAGGWVRDKLLGSQSNDIDVALSDSMGVPFATDLKTYAEGLSISTGKVGVIAKNPEQSKHLEAATLTIFGLELDFVNLRSEEYTEDSRIPTVKFGTPLEDALRRDITINSMFYNVHTRAVDDLTGKGMEDLRKGIIRTPLPPRQTFLDDPLRVLRCIRFCSRFGFKLTPEVKEAMQDTIIENALRTKVKRDRVGEELSKMMKGRDPFMAIHLVHECNLYDAVFAFLPPAVAATIKKHPTAPSDSLTASSFLHRLVNPLQSTIGLAAVHPALLSQLKVDSGCLARLFLAASFSSYSDATYVDQKKKTVPAISLLLRESLRLGTQHHFLDGIPALMAASGVLKNPGRFDSPDQRVEIGMLLRNKSVHNPVSGSHWTSSLLFSLVQELVSCYDLSRDSTDIGRANGIIEQYNSFVRLIEDLGLSQIADAKPLLNGGEVTKLLQQPPGPWTGNVLAEVIRWQILNVEGSKEACSEWLQRQHAAGMLDLGEPPNKKLRTK